MNADQIRTLNQYDRMLTEAVIKEITPYIWISLIGGIFWLITITDVIRSQFKSDSNKIMWILLLIFAAPAGVIFYSLIGNSQKITKNEKYSDLIIASRIKNEEEEMQKNEKWF